MSRSKEHKRRFDGSNRKLLSQAFGPGDWRQLAAKILGVSLDQVRNYGTRRNLSLQKRRAIATYCNQRRRARKQVVAREVARLERLWEAAERDWAAAETELRAKEAEFARQGRK